MHYIMDNTIYNGITKGTNFRTYNIYLNSPQLAVKANTKKYYEGVIQKNSIIMNQSIKKYPPSYFKTSYSRIFYPNVIIMPST